MAYIKGSDDNTFFRRETIDKIEFTQGNIGFTMRFFKLVVMGSKVDYVELDKFKFSTENILENQREIVFEKFKSKLNKTFNSDIGECDLKNIFEEIKMETGVIVATVNS